MTATSRTTPPVGWDFDFGALLLEQVDGQQLASRQDYAALIQALPPHPVLQCLFTAQPPPAPIAPAGPRSWADDWQVQSVDATQAAAIALARGGASCVILGAPGTGKSHTVLNLLADQLARGRRVLLVSEHHATLQGIWQQLQQCGLDRLGCALHEPLSPKALAQDLRQISTQWLNEPDTLDEAQQQRLHVLDILTQALTPLQRLEGALQEAPAHVGGTVQDLLTHLLALRKYEPALAPQAASTLPTLAAWRAHADLVQRLHQAAQHAGLRQFSEHALAVLGPAVLRHERPLNRLHGLVDRATQLLQRCLHVLAQALPAHAQEATLAELLSLVDHAQRLAGLAAREPLEQLDLLDPHSESSRQWDLAMAQWEVRTQTLDKALLLTMHWRDKLPSADAQAAQVLARQQELALLRWMTPAWRRLHADLQRRYDFSRHATPPPPSRVLAILIAEHRARAACEEIREQLRVQHGCHDVPAFAATLRQLREDTARQPLIAELHGQGLSAPPDLPERQQALADLAALAPEAQALAEVLTELLVDPSTHTLSTLAEQVHGVSTAVERLPALLVLLQELAAADPATSHWLRHTPWDALTLEAAIARATLARVLREQPVLADLDAVTRAQHVERLAEAEHELQRVNAHYLRATSQRRFIDQVRRSALPGGRLNTASQAFQSAYHAGRHTLAQDIADTPSPLTFHKLTSGDSGQVVRDLKPLWLMHPQTVADSLPLQTDWFDVVIVDDAHLTTVVGAIPALLRAQQLIVVGDEKQISLTEKNHSLLHLSVRRLPVAVLGRIYHSESGLPLEVHRPPTDEKIAPHSVRHQLAQALRERGHQVDEGVGPPGWRCDLAVRAPNGAHYALGILLGPSPESEGGDVFERDVFEYYVARPHRLRAQGWRCVQVLSLDWLVDAQQVIHHIEAALR